MNKEDYVSLEVAKILKEKGYDEYCGAYYHLYWMNECTEEESFEISSSNDFKNSNNVYRIGAPSLYEVAKWLRNKHDINVTVATAIPAWFKGIHDSSNTLYMPLITHKKEDGKTEMIIFRNLKNFNYEKVYNDAILEALKLI